jgi:ABC-type transport system involved in multi-copper enzyme maturation permease subunit
MRSLAIARRELAAYFFSPISYVVMTLFLVATGYEFWLLVALLNGREAPHGAVLQYFFGGTFLYWLFLMFIAAVITMRLVAEERRSGTLEPLLTAPVTGLDVIVGKYLGALAFYAALWAPTTLYLLLLRAYAPEGGAPDSGPIVAGYLGTLLVGASALALGLFASTLTKNQIIAAVLSFVGLSLLLLVGALGDALYRTGPWAGLLAHVNLFRHMEDFGRGIVDSRHVVYHLGLIVLGLFGATRFLVRRRGRFVLELALLLAVLAGVNWLSARHYARRDWTRGRTFALSDKTQKVLRDLKQPVQLIVFMLPSGPGASDLYDDVHELTDRAQAESRLLRVDWIDIDRERERAIAVGKRYNVSGEDVAAGVIIVDGGSSSRFLTRDELAEYDYAAADDGRPPPLKAWKGEQALVQALLEVTEEKAPALCFVKGHGERAIDSWEPGEYGDFAEELKRDHYAPRAIELEAGIPLDCALVVEAGPEQPLGKRDAETLGAYLERGGRLLVLDGPHFDPQVTRFAGSGLEEPLEKFGISLKNDLVLDEPRLRGSVAAFGVSEGYGDHPISAHLMHHRTLWAMAREVRALEKPGVSARELVHTGDAGWGETDPSFLAGVGQSGPSFDPAHDVKGPVSLGVAAEKGASRVVALGSAELAANREILGYNRDLLLSSVAWLLKKEPRMAIGPRTPEHLRLRLDDGQVTRVFLYAVVALPLFVLLLGGGVFWVRRS